MPKWPQTKRHTISNIIIKSSFSCSWCDPFLSSVNYLEMEVSDWLLKNSTYEKAVSQATTRKQNWSILQTKLIMPCERALKSVPENGAGLNVHF